MVSAKEEERWDIKVVVAVDSTGVRGRCIRQLAQTVKKNAKFLSNPAATVRYTAGIALQNAKATGREWPETIIHIKNILRN